MPPARASRRQPASFPGYQATAGTRAEQAARDALPGHPLARHIDDFLADLANANRPRNTIRAYRGDLTAFAAHHDGDIAGLTAAPVRAFLGEIAGQAPATRKRKRAAVASFCKWAVRHELLDASPIDRIDTIGVPRTLPRPAAAADIAAVLDAICSRRPRKDMPVGVLRDRALFETAYVCGARASEVCGMYVEDLDLRPDDEHARMHGKGGTVRTVLLDDRGYLALLRLYPARSGYTSGPLFRASINGRGGPLSYDAAHNRWKKPRNAASVAGAADGADDSHAGLSGLPPAQRDQALARWQVLRAHLEDGCPLVRVAGHYGVPERTLRRWLAAYRAGGLAALTRRPRSDRGTRRMPPELQLLIEGLALRRPPPTIATVPRQAAEVARDQGWATPGYAAVYDVVKSIDPAMATLAHEGPKRYKEVFDLVHRREAAKPNQIWQADHTLLDLWVLTPSGRPGRPWLTLVEDDHSRAVAGYAVNLGAPSALTTALAFRQAIWRKPWPGWHVCGIPEAFHVDHGSDFTSAHLEQVMADLKIRAYFPSQVNPAAGERWKGFLAPSTRCACPRCPGTRRAAPPTGPGRPG